MTSVWIKHWWSAPSFTWFRNLFCEAGTANNKCAVPLYGGQNFTTSDAWCETNYNATDCETIRKKAMSEMVSKSYFFLYSNAIGGAVLIILLLLALGLLEGIISAPIVQRSKESNISLWLIFPIVGCFGGYLAFTYTPRTLLSHESGANLNFIGICYLVTGVTFTVSALLGWFISAKTVLNSRDKTHKAIVVYLFIIMMVLTIFAVGKFLIRLLLTTINKVQICVQFFFNVSFRSLCIRSCICR